MGIMTTTSFPALLWPGIKKIWGLTYELWESGSEWKEIFEVVPSDKNYERDLALTGFGLAPAKTEADAVMLDTMSQGFATTYVNVTYALGFIISQEEIEDEVYPQVAAQRTKALAFSMQRTEEHVAANVLNRAFNGAFLGGDGKSMCASDHPLLNGTFSNQLAIAADISETSLEQASIDIEGFVDNRGNKIKILPKKLIIPRQLKFEVNRLLRNENRPETANRDINALYLLNTFSEGYAVNHYLTDPNNWFAITDCPDGLKKMDRVSTAFAHDNDFDTTNMKYRARARYTYGWTDPRGIYASNPA